MSTGGVRKTGESGKVWSAITSVVVGAIYGALTVAFFTATVLSTIFAVALFIDHDIIMSAIMFLLAGLFLFGTVMYWEFLVESVNGTVRGGEKIE